MTKLNKCKDGTYSVSESPATTTKRTKNTKHHPFIATQQLAKLRNDTETIFPDSDFRFFFETTALSVCEK